MIHTRFGSSTAARSESLVKGTTASALVLCASTAALTLFGCGQSPGGDPAQAPKAPEAPARELSAYEQAENRLLPVGRIAPAFEGVDIQTRKVTLTENKGKVILLNFWFES